MKTPCGHAQQVITIADGITLVSTARTFVAHLTPRVVHTMLHND